MKNVLLLVHDDDGQEARLQAALDLVRAIDGHLTCVDVTWTPPLISNGFYDNAYAVAEVLTEEVERESRNKVALAERLSAEALPWNWIDTTGDLAVCLERAAGLADVIVVNRQIRSGAVPDMLHTANELIVRSGKPVFAVPADIRQVDFRSALVAWDGSDAATAALQAAVPLLRTAAQVTLVEVGDGSVAVPAEEAAQYLSRHDVHPVIRRIDGGRRAAADALLQEASSGAFGYLVMGGYGHARWVESVFGGMTRAMLTRSPIPLFLAH